MHPFPFDYSETRDIVPQKEILGLLERHSKIRRTIYVPSLRWVFYWHQLEAQIVNVMLIMVASCKYRKETTKEQKVRTGYSSYWINISPNFSQRTRVGQIWLVTVELSLMKHNTLIGKTWCLSPWPNSSSKARERVTTFHHFSIATRSSCSQHDLSSKSLFY